MIEMKRQNLQTQILGVSTSAASLQLKVSQQLQAARSVNWEVFADGELEPLRFGLCLLDAKNGTARVNVTGLRPHTKYHCRFVCNGQAAVTAAFETSALLGNEQRAA